MAWTESTDDTLMMMPALRATHALKPLLRDGLVDLHPDERDKRAKRAALTRAGNKRLAEAIVFWANANQRVEEALGSDSAETLRTLADFVASDDFLAAYVADKDSQSAA